MADRQQGTSATDSNLCANFGPEISDCQITRAPTAFVVHDGYTVSARMNDQRALEKLANDYVYTDESLKGHWDGFTNYRRTGQQADLYLGNPETTDYTIALSGGLMEKAIPGCQVRSPWYDLDLDGKRENGTLRYHYRLTRKARWLTHDEIVSPAFGQMIDQARACAEQVHQVVKLQGGEQRISGVLRGIRRATAFAPARTTAPRNPTTPAAAPIYAARVES